MVEADQRHRDHAIIEQVVAELKEGPLAHLPSGKYAANAAWVACGDRVQHRRAAAVGADLAKARWATPPAGSSTSRPGSRRHRPTGDPAPAQSLVMGIGLDVAEVHRDRPARCRHDLTIQPGARGATED